LWNCASRNAALPSPNFAAFFSLSTGPTPSEATERRIHSSAVVSFVLVCMLLLTVHALGGDGLRDNVVLAEREQHVDHRPLDRNPRFCTSRLWPTNTHIMDSRSSWLRER
jgi:hypothetical protein